MRGWEWRPTLEPSDHEPLFEQIARSIAGDIRRGRLKPGEQLPSSRKIAEALGVHRNTALSAYGELEAQGWIEARPSSGTYVSSALPVIKPKSFASPALDRGAMPERPCFALKEIEAPMISAPVGRGELSMAGGLPDLRLIPTEELARAWRRAVRRGGGELMGYADPQGHPRLRAALAQMLSTTRGVAASPEHIMVTRGSQMALYLTAHALLDPGDRVAIEAHGYPAAWTALRSAGATLVPVPVDGRGLDVEALAAVVREGPIKAVYVTPHHQYPTMAVLDAGRRLELLALARAEGFAIIEDDYDNEFHYEGRPVLPLASADRHGAVIYIGTLSKVLAPALRVGYAVAPAPVIAALGALRATIDRQGDQATEAALAELIEDDAIQRHARRIRRIYRARRERLAQELREHLPDVLDFQIPSGGLSLWAACAPEVDPERWAERAASQGVLFWPARRYDFQQRPLPFVRLGFAALDEDEIRRAVQIMKRALPCNP